MVFTFRSWPLWLFILYAVISVIIIILERKRPEKTIAWLLVFVLLPPFGLILYIFLGRNWKRHKLTEDFSPYVRDLIYRVINRIENPEYIPLIELLAKNSDSPLFVDNDITLFKNGNEKFKSLKDEIKKAKHHIHLEYYIVKSDAIGTEIKDLLIEKAKEGVSVKFIIDRVGSIKMKNSAIRELRAAGIDVIQYSYFLAPLLRAINTQINYRNHRKIVVIDGHVGFIGGINIGDEYLGKGKLGYWRDTHIMVKGDFVLGLQAVFLDDYFTIKRISGDYFLNKDDFKSYFPEPIKSNKQIMQLVKSGPDSEFPAIMQGVLKMITMAKKNIYITTPYFVPTESIMEALKMAALSGVDVRILFPGRYDHVLVYLASRTYLAELIRCGAKVYFYSKDSFIHSKVMTIDSKISTIGTANMDIRSYELNYEINAVIYDDAKTKELENQFFADLDKSIEISIEDFDNITRFHKILEATARVFSALL
ncbi:cardiolipin synthase [Clostridium swellfunianum]|uniref:cardiolipin synthase n=1 Tax=Clostridium swellfunianum TaxID=1367462 RepID=UPI00202FF54F|nr:cardiolipin synthase [Clostridium swellfunianum]MCM0648236.1 cardiolipin synthase [Clostridium swellfunianum]